MKYLRIAVWACLLTLSMMLPANAAPVAAAVGAIVGILKVGGIAATFIKLAFGIALQVAGSLLQKMMMKKQSQPGITGQIQVGGNSSLSFIVGTYATAGHLEYINTHGKVGDTPNAVLTQVITLSDLPLNSISNIVSINGETCTRNPSLPTTDEAAKFGATSYPVAEYKESKWYFLFLKYYLGNQVSADANMVSTYGASERLWSSDMVGRGLSYVIATAEMQRKLMTAIPKFRFEVQGIRLYDPRRDSGIGGSGPHRWGDEATYQWTDNPVVIIYNILRGIYFNGDYIYGAEMPAHSFPLSSWFAAMNECDLLIPLAGGGTEKQYRCGYEIKALEQEPVDVIEELLKACNGRMAEVGGVYRIHVGAPGLPVAFITDADFVVTDEQKFDAFPGLENTFNGVTATYPEPQASWEMKDAPQRRFPTYEAEDGGRILLADVQYNAVPFPVQVQRLMQSLAEESRRIRKHVGTLPPWAFILEPLDVISYTSLRNGYSNKLFLAVSLDDQINVNQSVSLTEVDPSDYNWTPGTDTLPWSVGPLIPNWPAAQILTGWSVRPASLYDEKGGARRPSIEVSFDGNQADIRAVQVQVRPGGGEAVQFDGEVPYGERVETAKAVILNGQFSPDTVFEVRGKFVPFSGRATDWSGWLSVTTDNIRFGPADLYPFDVGSFNDDLLEMWKGQNDAIRYGFEEQDRIGKVLADLSVTAFTQRQTMRRELTVTSEGNLATFREEIYAAVGPGSAISSRVETLEVKVNNDIATAVSSLTTQITTVNDKVALNASDITTLKAEMPNKASAAAVDALIITVTSQGDAITAQGTSINGLTAQVGNTSAQGLFRTTVEANQGGSLARVGLSAAASSPAGASQAAIFIEAIAGGKSRVVVDADAFIVTSSANRAAPMAFIGGELTLRVVNVGAAYFDTLHSRNGKLIMRGYDDFSDFRMFF